MKRIIISISALVVVGLALAFYFEVGVSQEVKRDRYLKKGRDYIAEGKIREGIIELRNALKTDPANAGAHHELGLALLKRGDLRAAFREFVRASDLNPALIEPRIQLGNLYLLRRDLANAKAQLVHIRANSEESLQGHVFAAKIALAEKRHDEALKELEEALAKDPERASLYVDVGAIHALKRDFKAAEQAFRKALEVEPKHFQARIALAGLYLAIGDQEKAEEELILATKADPENEGLLHILGNFYSRTRQFDDYEKIYRELVEKKPDSIIAKKRMTEILLFKRDRKQAKAYVDQILKAQPGDVDGHYFQGRLLLAEKKYPETVQELSLVTRNAPRFAAGFYYLGLAHFGNNETKQGISSLVQALELNPLWFQPRLLLAQTYLLTGDFELASQEAEKLLQTHPKHPTVLSLNGVSQLRRGKLDQALNTFKRLKDVSPKDPAPWINTGAVYQLQKKFPLAVKEYEEALKLNADRIDALASIAAIRAVQGDRKGAYERLEQHMPKTKKQAGVYLLLGQLSLADRDFVKGIGHLEKAIELNPNHLQAYVLIGNAYAAQKKFDQAIAQYQKASEKNRSAIGPYMLLGILHDFKQDHAKANEYYQKTLDMNKNFAPAANNLAWNYAEHGGNLDIALGLAQRAREASPDNPQIGDTLGWIYYKKGVYATAVGLLKESNEKLQGKNPVVLYHLGMALYKNREKDLAFDNLRKALELSQNFPGADEAKRILAAPATQPAKS